ncbi:MAG: Rieske (2Fe-2S) protein [Persicimonas sp.]
MSSRSKDDDLKIERRVFLQGLGAAVGCSLLQGCEFVEVAGDGEGQNVEFSLDDPQFSALEEIGETACIDAGSLELLLIRKDDEEILAVERFCPHQGEDMGPCDDNRTPAEWDKENHQLTCQWHFTTFDDNGDVVERPADDDIDRGLRIYPVDFDPETGRGIVRAAEEPTEGEA